jgi:hypothetical protein
MTPDFELYDSQGARIGFSDNWTGSNTATLDISLNLGGTYTLIASARGNSNTGNYNLTWQKLNAPCNAAPTACGVTTPSSISTAGEQDHYTLTAAPGDKATIRLIRTAGTMTPDFELYDSQGARIGFSDNWTGSNTATLDISLNLGGTYTLIASARGNTDTGNYNLTWQKLNAPCNATPTACGVTNSSSIFAVGEQDHYSLTAAANDNVSISMVRTSGTMAPDFELYDSQGTRIGFSDNWTGSSTATLNASLNLGGTYTLIASARGNNNTGNYNLIWQFSNKPCATTTSLQFSLAAYSVNENGGSATITVTRTGGSSGAVGVSYATNNGSASAGSDYTSTSGILSWMDGDLADKTFTVPILTDTLAEGNETVNLTLSTPTGGAVLGSPSTAFLSIIDVPVTGTLQFSSAIYSVNENGGSATITVTRTGGSSGAVGVSYATSNGSASAGTDYTAASGILSWPNGDTSARTFTVPINNDGVNESNETVNLALSNPTGGATLGLPSTAVLNIANDDPVPAGVNISFTILLNSNPYAELQWGWQENATDNYDSGIDALAPPASPDGDDAYFASITGQPSPLEKLAGDFRAATEETKTWRLILKVAEGKTLRLQWDPQTLPPDWHFFLQEADANWAGAAPAVNMNNPPAEVTFDNQTGDPLTRRYLVRATRGYPLSLKAGGWNLVSLPVEPVAPAPPSIFGTNLMAVFEWDCTGQRYLIPSTILAKRGYWVAVSLDTDLEVPGVPPADSSAALCPGWNLVGPLQTVPVPALPPVLAVYAWGWPPEYRYVLPTQCADGKGYWIAASQAGEVW